jgi:hypothetical protein
VEQAKACSHCEQALAIPRFLYFRIADGKNGTVGGNRGSRKTVPIKPLLLYSDKRFGPRFGW